MNYNLVEYIKSIDGLKFKPGFECNSIGFNILNLTSNKNNKVNKEITQIVNELHNCKNVFSIKEVIKKYGDFEKYLKLLNYRMVNDRILPGDFLVKKRKYINDVIYCIDAITFIGVGLRVPHDKSTQQIIISRDLIITDKHKIWRKI